MRLQKIFLAVMAVVIAAATIAFYRIPQPLLPEDAVVTVIHHMSVRRYPEMGIGRLQEYDVTDAIDVEELSNILRKYTRGRWSNENRYYQLGDGEIDLLLMTEQQGSIKVLNIVLGGNEIGGKEHDVNYVSVHSSGEFRIHDADDLRAELTALIDSSIAVELEPIPEPEPLPEPDPVQERLDGMTLEQKLGQLFFVRCPESGGETLAASDRCPGGFLLFARDFADRTAQQATDRIAGFQTAAQTPLLIGVDEEGGTVVRVSRYFREEKFASPRALYNAGGLDAILADTAEKNAFLASFGINVNLAPVADLSTDPADFIYPRALGEDAETTSAYIAAVVEQMNADGMGSVLKHFPGYGSNVDTHTDRAVDDRPLSVFENADLLPFKAGIEADAPCILVSHNIVPAFGDEQPGSMSPAIVRYLREEMAFDGVIMTDDLAMAAAGVENAAVLAVQAGCDLLITSDYDTQYAEVLAAVQNGEIAEDVIDAAAYRVLTWKQTLNLF